MSLALIDWVIIIGLITLFLIISISLKNKASSSLSDFFLGGRNLPWYVAGLSMVATTFAADTPLYVTEVVRENGISSNWQWWSLLISGMLTTFFFAKLWRRANVLTELEFLELRYEGKLAKFLVGFKSIYLGVFLNVIVIGWVNFALIQILQAFFGIEPTTSLWITALAMAFAAVYSSISGILGVAITDAIQFFIAMAGTIILAIIVLNNEKVGGIEGLKAQIPSDKLNFLPNIGETNGSTFTISIMTFISYIGIQWWASWFPGAEPGGGGYIAQRIMSTKNENHALLSSLFFNIAHYCLRPWPWIIVALGTLILYPEATGAESSATFIYTMKDLLPNGLKGLLIAAFMSAYLSTISTQLNWGASFLSNDFYKRFIYKGNSTHPETDKKKFVLAGRVSTIIIMLIALIVTPFIESIKPAWDFLLGTGAGLGLVLILRWFWWRINAWSELSATITPFIVYGACLIYAANLTPEAAEQFKANNIAFYITTLITTIVWISVTFITQPESEAHLRKFFKQVQPTNQWKLKHGDKVTLIQSDKGINVKFLFVSWISSVAFTYSFLFLIGKLIFQEFNDALFIGLSAIISGIILYWSFRKSNMV